MDLTKYKISSCQTGPFREYDHPEGKHNVKFHIANCIIIRIITPGGCIPSTGTVNHYSCSFKRLSCVVEIPDWHCPKPILNTHYMQISAPASNPFTLWGSPWKSLVPMYSIDHFHKKSNRPSSIYCRLEMHLYMSTSLRLGQPPQPPTCPSSVPAPVSSPAPPPAPPQGQPGKPGQNRAPAKDPAWAEERKESKIKARGRLILVQPLD